MDTTKFLKSIVAALAATTAIFAITTPANAYSYYVWRQQTADYTESDCSRIAYRTISDAGYTNVHVDNASASGEKDGVTINVNCIKDVNSRVVAILYAISDDDNAAKAAFEWQKKVLYGPR